MYPRIIHEAFPYDFSLRKQHGDPVNTKHIYSEIQIIHVGLEPTSNFNKRNFDGQNPNGDWTLFIADMAAGGTLTLSDWSMEITVVPEPQTYVLVAGICLMLWGALRKFAFLRFS